MAKNNLPTADHDAVYLNEAKVLCGITPFTDLGLGFNHLSWSPASHVLTRKLGQNHGKLEITTINVC